MPQQADDFFPALAGIIENVLDDEGLGDDVFHAHVRVQGRGGVLKDDLHLALAFLPQVRGRVVDVVAVEEDAARGGRIQAHDGAGQRGLSAAALTHKAQDLAAVQGKADVMQDLRPLPAQS